MTGKRKHTLAGTTAAALARGALLAALAAAGVSVAAGCYREDMNNQPRHEPHEESDFFADGQASRPLVAGTVPHDKRFVDAPRPDNMRFSGAATEKPTDTFPIAVNEAVLRRGQERYNIYCSVCHGATGGEHTDDKSPLYGRGNGMIVQRGFTPPPSLHDPAVRDKPAGHYYNVITNGWGAMYSYSDRITPEDRWAIVAYIRALQLTRTGQANAAATTKPATTTQPAGGAGGGGGGGATTGGEAARGGQGSTGAAGAQPTGGEQ